MGNTYSGSCLKTNIAQIADGDIKKSDLEKLIKPCKVKKTNNQQTNPNRSWGQANNRPYGSTNTPATSASTPTTGNVTEGFSMSDYGNSNSMMVLIWIILIVFLIYAAYKYSGPKAN